MNEPESESIEPEPKLRWFQFSLRAVLVFVTLASVLCSIGVCFGRRVALAIVVLAIFYGGGLVDRRRSSVALVFRPPWLPALLHAILLLMSVFGGFAVLLLIGTILTPTGDPYSVLLTTMAVSIVACICYAFGRRMGPVPITTDTGVLIGRPFQLALVVLAGVISLLCVFLAVIGL